jgi:hypothetical protein
MFLLEIRRNSTYLENHILKTISKEGTQRGREKRKPQRDLQRHPRGCVETHDQRKKQPSNTRWNCEKTEPTKRKLV